MNFFRQWWQSMGHWRWLNLLPIVIALFLALRYESMPLGWIDHGTVSLGDIEVGLASQGAIRAGERLPLQLTVSAPVALEVGFTGQDPLTVDATDFDEQRQWRQRITVPDSPNAIATVAVSNAQYSARWVLGRLIL